MSQRIRVRQDYSRHKDGELSTALAASITGQDATKDVLKNWPVDAATSQTVLDGLSAAIAARPNAGLAGTAARDNQRAAAIAILKKQGHYVQDNCNGDPEIVLKAGFSLVTNKKSTPAPLPVPSITGIDFGNTTQLIARGKAIPLARNYELQKAELGAGNTPGPWQPAGTFASARAMIVTGLTPGTTYLFQIRAYTGPGGFTDWSGSFSHIAL